MNVQVDGAEGCTATLPLSEGGDGYATEFEFSIPFDLEFDAAMTVGTAGAVKDYIESLESDKITVADASATPPSQATFDRPTYIIPTAYTTAGPSKEGQCPSGRKSVG